MMTEVMRAFNERKLTIQELRRAVSPQRLADLVAQIRAGTISNNTAKDVFGQMLESGEDAKTIIDKKGLRQISDAGELDGIVDKVLAENPSAVSDYKAGKEAALKWLMGQIMRQTRGKANPQVIGKLLAEKLSR
jgi:aspartyl-tRNA(Asn)/glutamyl-tRNA(Gln) amidotransferase subunit B